MAAKKSTAVATWDEELAKHAAEYADMEANSGGGQFFTMKSGVLSWQDAPLPNNQMAVIILDSILENVYYEGEYDPDSPQGPTCFAFGRSEKDMAPHELVVQAGTAQCETCDGCEMNEFGSADKGKGKACKNTRRLAMIPAGKFMKDGSFEMIEDLEHFETAEVGYMKLPVTSVKGYSTFVKQVVVNVKRPIFGVVALVKVIPDQKSQFRVVFEAISELPDELLQTILNRHNEVKAVIDFPYTPREDEPAPARGKKTAAKGKPAAKTKRKY